MGELLHHKENSHVSLTGVITGGLLPPTPEGLLKIARDESFSHIIQHEASNRRFSTPPEFRNQTVWGQNVPRGLKQECYEIVRKSLGDLAEGLDIEAYRLCWYVSSTALSTCSADLLTIYQGTRSHQIRVSSSRRTLIVVISTLLLADPSTLGNFCPLSAPISCRCCREHWRPRKLRDGLGIERVMVEELMEN